MIPSGLASDKNQRTLTQIHKAKKSLDDEIADSLGDTP